MFPPIMAHAIKRFAEIKAVWLGGLWRESQSGGVRRGAWTWEGTIQTVSNETANLWFPGFYNWKRGKRPAGDFRKKSCIAMSRIFVDADRKNQTTDVDYFWWDNVSCKQRLSAVCQRPYFATSFLGESKRLFF